MIFAIGMIYFERKNMIRNKGGFMLWFKNFNKKRIGVLILISFLIFVGIGCNTDKIPSESQQVQSISQEQKSPRIEKVTIAAVGDIMVHSPQFRSAYIGGKQKYDFYPVFQPIEKYIQQADIAIANLETTFAGAQEGYSGYPMFNSPQQLGRALKQTGFDVITTANNHCLDRRTDGLKSTLNFLDSYGLDHTGTARNQEERNKILIKKINNINIAFLAYTYGTNGIPVPEEEPYLVNLAKKEQIALDIQKAKQQKADMIVVSMHFGNEYQREESQEQKEWVDFLLKQGVDVILGSHPHVLQRMEIRKVHTIDGKDKDAFLIYSLGNFLSNQRDRYKDSGVILQISFEKNFDTGKTSLQKVEYIPTWVDKSNVNGKIYYHILAVEQAISQYQLGENEMLSEPDYELLQRTWKDTTELLQQDNEKMVIKTLK
ncbi:poly-gamma-glutamate synthesis protein (capsule biosynthesis protein) [Garciella nitratireducens DSM 15102]|uniref:Poly-gamma-glutamate synthesis protein (Capsule biosynthesis protein) n=2 Tax=Garciella TaxID=218204 RepID=A0A1T4L4T4_9FIRM|nr:poly-gamma-glutamate synthesis protein (capsule biosynthesis protein) [Garciella nitratireducens DSM 15102]